MGVFKLTKKREAVPTGQPLGDSLLCGGLLAPHSLFQTLRQLLDLVRFFDYGYREDVLIAFCHFSLEFLGHLVELLSVGGYLRLTYILRGELIRCRGCRGSLPGGGVAGGFISISCL